MDVHIKFGDSGSNCSRDIRLLHFATDDERRWTQDVTKGENLAFCRKILLETSHLF